jgi:hypothetical protein
MTTRWPSHALHLTRRRRLGCSRCVPCAGSLSLGRQHFMKQILNPLILALVASAASAHSQTFRTNEMNRTQAQKISSHIVHHLPAKISEHEILTFVGTNGLPFGYTVGGKNGGTLFFLLSDGWRLEMTIAVTPYSPATRLQRSVGYSSSNRQFDGLAPIERLGPCLNNLRQIEGATVQWAIVSGRSTNAIPDWEDIIPHLAYRKLQCPEGGTYTLGPVNGRPSCSIAAHRKLSDEEYALLSTSLHSTRR